MGSDASNGCSFFCSIKDQLKAAKQNVTLKLRTFLVETEMNHWLKRSQRLRLSAVVCLGVGRHWEKLFLLHYRVKGAGGHTNEFTSNQYYKFYEQFIKNHKIYIRCETHGYPHAYLIKQFCLLGTFVNLFSHIVAQRKMKYSQRLNCRGLLRSAKWQYIGLKDIRTAHFAIKSSVILHVPFYQDVAPAYYKYLYVLRVKPGKIQR